MSSSPRVQRILSVAVLLMVLGNALAQTADPLIFVARAQKAFDLAQKECVADTNSPAAKLHLARASFDLADMATNEAQRAEFARRGIEVCRQWLAREPKSAACHYYLAMNLGELAQAQAPSLTAYKLVHEVEREFKLSTELDAKYDYAGPARNLGELYFQAPGWPLSVGSKRKAIEWIERAAVLSPEYPENQLSLAEVQLKWRQYDALVTTIKNMEAIWPAARTNFTGEMWEQSWQDWDARRRALKTEFQKIHYRAP